MTGHVKSRNLPEHHALKLARFELMAKAQLVNLGAAIRERREELGLSHARLAQRIPVDPKTVSRWEKGNTAGAYDSLDVIAEHLETSADALQARAIAIGRVNGEPATPKTPAEGLSSVFGEIAAAENVAKARHAEVMTELAAIRSLLEDQQKPEQLGGHRRAGG
jgi:transcriptional regulator with XRE-family HTH domain